METPILDLQLSPMRHPAVTEARDKRTRAEAAARELDAVVEAAASAVTEARRELGRLEFALDLGEEVSDAAMEDAREALAKAERREELAAAEVARRRNVKAEIAPEIAAAHEEACEEIEETVAPLIHALTQRYLEAVHAAFDVGQQLDAIYAQVDAEAKLALLQIGGNRTPRLPHGSPVIPFLTPGAPTLAGFMADYFRRFEYLGYTIPVDAD